MKNKQTNYYFKGNSYLIVDKVKIKIGEDWIDGILYKKKELSVGELYVRTALDFYSKFKLEDEL